jgi:tRNA threonylcarbamoyladenosine biosynthesis protein TsaE
VSTSAAFETVTHAESETEALGATLARLLHGRGGVIALRGDLAAGKTCFVRGMARALGETGYVHSPTFTLINEYGQDDRLFHLDLYRLGGSRELFDLGYEEIFDGPHLAAVEWAERAEELLPERRVEVALEHAGGDTRRVQIADNGMLPEGWQDELRAVAP